MNRFGKRLRYAIFLSLALTLLCRCKSVESEYTGLEHRGTKQITITQFSQVDTLFIDAGPTSLDGFWLMNGDKLLFFDNSVVGVREYDMQGNFLSRHISKGRGPNEMVAATFAAAVTDNGGAILIDGNWRIFDYDSLYHRANDSYQFLSDLKLDSEDWMKVLSKPDPEIVYMYEFNNIVRRIGLVKRTMIMPVITEHVKYNGYEKASNARDYWREAYNFLFIDLDSRTTGKLFGHYPPVYDNGNIPIFSTYDFDVNEADNTMYVGYAADSLIYVRDVADGRLLYSIGFGNDDVADSYPSTKSFNEYESKYREHRDRYGYYTRLYASDGMVFREYKKNGQGEYGIQIYENDNLTGDIPVDSPIKIIGNHDGWYYAELPVDIDNERFILLKFKL